jgi:hypothetical protein
VALGEADETWPHIIEDAANRCLKDVYAPVNAFGQEHKPDLGEYPKIAWESLDLEQFNQIPPFLRPVFKSFGIEFEGFHLIPIESGRGCPYGLPRAFGEHRWSGFSFFGELACTRWNAMHVTRFSGFEWMTIE